MPETTLRDFMFNDKYIKVECNFHPFHSHIYVNVGRGQISIIVTTRFYIDRSTKEIFSSTLYRKPVAVSRRKERRCCVRKVATSWSSPTANPKLWSNYPLLPRMQSHSSSSSKSDRFQCLVCKPNVLPLMLLFWQHCWCLTSFRCFLMSRPLSSRPMLTDGVVHTRHAPHLAIGSVSGLLCGEPSVICVKLDRKSLKETVLWTAATNLLKSSLIKCIMTICELIKI